MRDHPITDSEHPDDVELMPEAQSSGRRVKRLTRPQFLTAVIATAAIVLLGVTAAIAVPMLLQQSREQRFVSIIRADHAADYSKVSDAQLARSLDGECQLVDQGWNLSDVETAAARNYDAVAGPVVSLEQYLANNVAMFKAAEAVC